jgi:hypothetical protein
VQVEKSEPLVGKMLLAGAHLILNWAGLCQCKINKIRTGVVLRRDVNQRLEVKQ